MTVKNLIGISFDEILDCFLLAFENYYVEMPTESIYYMERWKAAKVDFNLSYGMFDREKLVGFIIHAVDTRFGVRTAYNTGTGVLPEYRGKRIVKSIYEYAIQDLQRNGIEKVTLEVITENERAIRSYESIGFEICRNYKCYKGAINIDDNTEFDTMEVHSGEIDWDRLPNQQRYSWDNQKESIINAGYRYFQVVTAYGPESYFIIKAENQYLAQFGLLNEDNTGWNRLFSAIKQMSSTIRINNVDDRLTDKVDILRTIGLENVADQFEMELKI